MREEGERIAQYFVCLQSKCEEHKKKKSHARNISNVFD